MGGDGRTIDIDECLLRGKRKNNVGRLRLGDIIASIIDDPAIIWNRNYGGRL